MLQSRISFFLPCLHFILLPLKNAILSTSSASSLSSLLPLISIIIFTFLSALQKPSFISITISSRRSAITSALPAFILHRLHHLQPSASASPLSILLYWFNNQQPLPRLFIDCHPHHLRSCFLLPDQQHHHHPRQPTSSPSSQSALLLLSAAIYWFQLL